MGIAGSVRPRWRKVWRELWLYRARTLLVILSIAVGVFAVGMIAGGWEILQREMPAAYGAVDPSSAVLYTTDFDDTLLQTVSRMAGVADAVGRRTVATQVQVGPEQWARLQLIALSSYTDMPVNRIVGVTGATVPAAKALLVERAGLGLLNQPPGTPLTIETADNLQRTLDFTGVVYDPTLDPSTFSGTINGFIDRETLPWLGQSRAYNQLYFTVSENGMDRAHIQAVADAVRKKVQKAGVRVFVAWVPIPGEHPTHQIVEAVLFVLAALGITSLIVSSFLVINTISAIVTQQTRQLGIMKALGADAGQLRQLYQGMVLIYGVIATVIAIPLATGAAIYLTGYVAGLLNFDILSYHISWPVFVLELAVGLLTPLLASWWPIRQGTQMAVRQALDSRSAGTEGVQSGWLEQTIARFDLFSRPFLLAFRNTFRRKGRLILALATLTLGIAICIAIFTIYSSVQRTVGNVSQAWRYDATVYFEQNYLAARVEQLLRKAPAVAQLEAWYMLPVRILRPDESESDDIQVEAPPAATTLFQPTLLAGRWLTPGERDAVVINSLVLDVEPGLAVGQQITFKLGERKVSWRIVGIVAGTLAGPRMYIDYAAFTYAVRTVGETNSVRLALAPATTTPDAQIVALADYLQGVGLKVGYLETTAQTRGQVQFQFGILLAFLTIMAVLVLLVGGIGLTGTMSINVLERVAEIGVLRAIGASNWSVMKLFLSEGLVVGLVSWVLAVPLALPISRFLCAQLGMVLIQTPLNFDFSLLGLLLSLLFIVVVAMGATYFPARNATRLSVREILTYE